MEIENKKKVIAPSHLQAFLQGRMTKAQFNLAEFSEENIRQSLSMCYAKAVSDRGFLASIDADTNNHIAKMANWLCSGDKTTWGMIICGQYGNGKTTMLHALQNLFNALQKPLVIVSALDVATMASNASADFEKLKICPILALDDIGTEQSQVKNYGNVITPVSDIIVSRYNKRLLTFITTNYDKKALAERYGGFIGDRFNEMFDVLQFNNVSYRGKSKGGVR